MATEWFCLIEGAVTGPYTAAQLQTLAGDGQLPPDAQVRRSKNGEWVRADAVKGLRFAPKPTVSSFRIKGRDRHSGQMREAVIVAASEEDAYRRAAHMGIVTGTVYDTEVLKESAEQQARQREEARDRQRIRNAFLSVGPRQWRYRMVQIPTHIGVNKHTSTRGSAAGYLEEVVEQYAEQGWEFYRSDEIGVRINPGWLAALFGGQPSYQRYYVLTFRVSVATEPSVEPSVATDPA